MYIYPFSKRLQFEKIMKYIHLLFNFSYKASLVSLMRKQKVCIYFMYIFKLQRF